MPRPKGKPRKPVAENPGESPAPQPGNPKLTWNDIRYFTPRELTCTCDGLCDHPVAISLDLVAKLDTVRKLIDLPVRIVSGTRCKRHNQRIGGALFSAHVPKSGVSHAADVACPDARFRFAFLTAALPLFNRIGIGKDFIHVDDDPDLPSNVVWVC